MLSRLLAPAGAALLLACATATPKTYIAPTSETVVSTVDEREADPPTHSVYIENHSTVPITVFSISLNRCDNTRPTCGPHPANLKIAPGSRMLATRVQAADPTRAWNYSFAFSWRADSAYTRANAILAQVGDPKAQAILRADSIRKLDTGPSFHELTREDFTGLGPTVARLRMMPESLTVAPGTAIGGERFKALLLDQQGNVLGQTRWLASLVPDANMLRPGADGGMIARAPGRVVVRFHLPAEAEELMNRKLGDVEFPVIVAYPPDAHAPTFLGRVLDADSKTPLQCVSVALEDSAQNIVATGHTGRSGSFVLSSPRAGTYRVRVDTRGWAPSYGPSIAAAPDADVQREYLVRFTEQLLVWRDAQSPDTRHAQPSSVTTPLPAARGGRGAVAAAPVSSVTLGGTDILPILGIVGRVAPGTTWTQFVVDSLGVVDSATIMVPSDAPAGAKPSIVSLLPRVRFSPAMDAGAPVCEMIRMRVDLKAR